MIQLRIVWGFFVGLCLLVSDALPAPTTAEHQHIDVLAKRSVGKASLHTSGEAKIGGRFIVFLNRPFLKAQFDHLIRNIRELPGHEISGAHLLDEDESTVTMFEIYANERAIETLRTSQHVDFVEETQIFRNVAVKKSSMGNGRICYMDNKTRTWGWDRTNERAQTRDKYGDSMACEGSNVDIFIFDSGINLAHEEFEGRAIWGKNLIDFWRRDFIGHGTHVAGTAAGKTFGVARTARLVAVKVLTVLGIGTTSSVLKGIKWIQKFRKHHPNRRGVVNMSVGGKYSRSVNELVRLLVESGTAVVAAAGNSNHDACTKSPGSELSTITVGCSDVNDEFCKFSNSGPCVDIIAPGDKVTSSFIGGRRATKSLSGTSMSAPHVTGVLANYFSCHPKASVADAKRWLLQRSTKCAIKKVPRDTPNLLLFDSCYDKPQEPGTSSTCAIAPGSGDSTMDSDYKTRAEE